MRAGSSKARTGKEVMRLRGGNTSGNSIDEQGWGKGKWGEELEKKTTCTHCRMRICIEVARARSISSRHTGHSRKASQYRWLFLPFPPDKQQKRNRYFALKMPSRGLRRDSRPLQTPLAAQPAAQWATLLLRSHSCLFDTKEVGEKAVQGVGGRCCSAGSFSVLSTDFCD